MLSKQDYWFFEKAKKASAISDYPKIHVGCVASYKGNIISVGCNTNKTHPRQEYYNRYRCEDDFDHNCLPKMHAEINCLNAIRHSDIQFSKVKLYIYRSRNDRAFGIARPCRSCMAAIRDMGIRHIYYTTNDGFCYENVEGVKE